MGIYNKTQSLAQELIDKLGDKKKGSFGCFMGLIKRHGEQKIRATLSDVLHDHRTGKVANKVKIFMYRLKNDQNRETEATYQNNPASDKNKITETKIDSPKPA